MDDKVVITGAGLVTALGTSLSETWDALLSGESGIRPITGFDAGGFSCTAAAEVQGLGPGELNVHPRDSRIMDMHSYVLMKCSRDAFRQSELDRGSVRPGDIGFFAGMGMVDYNVEDLLPSVLKSLNKSGNVEYDRFFSQGYTDIHPLWPLSMLNNISFCQVAIDLGIQGDNTVFSPHADSGIHAVIEAYNAVAEKRSMAVLAGGVSEKVSPLSMARASLHGILDTSGRMSGQWCRPFCKSRKGTVLGEGGGVVTLESDSSARARQVPRLASIAGYGASFEPGEETGCPSRRAIRLSMEKALGSADLAPSDIDVVIAHGDGTVHGDRHEAEAIHEIFSGRTGQVHVYSSKGALGNLMAGAPAADVIIGICILKHGIIPAACSSSPVDDEIAFNVICDEPLRAGPGRILINARSYEGQCASLIIEKAV